MSTLYLAARYLRYHLWRSIVLCLAVGFIAAIPLAVHLLVAQSERQLLARAEATPLLVGARGSALDLVLSSLYFSGDTPAPASIAASDDIWSSGLAVAIPLHVRFKAQGAPIVGTTLDYFDVRGLELAAGRGLAVLGEAVLGAAAAAALDLGPGDTLISSPENLFDLAGVYPLRMSVVGVLAPADTPDDGAVFVDIKTSWVIQGIGHGHSESGAQPASAESNIVADPAIEVFNEITPDNIDSFHFHGDPAAYPVTAVIAVPADERSATILRGRYLEPDDPLQVVRPLDTVNALLETVFRIRGVLDALVAAAALAAVLALVLSFYLSVQLRRAEIETIFRIGCRPGTVARLVGAEIAIILAAGAVVAAILSITIILGMETFTLWLLS